MEKALVDTGIVVAVVLGAAMRAPVLEETRDTSVIPASSLPYEVRNARTKCAPRGHYGLNGP
ncbi:hypothetical protein GGP88_001182 [Salinibacter ruber]|nr:hypothetical protein [Salinibacter ruber]